MWGEEGQGNSVLQRKKEEKKVDFPLILKHYLFIRHDALLPCDSLYVALSLSSMSWLNSNQVVNRVEFDKFAGSLLFFYKKQKKGGKPICKSQRKKWLKLSKNIKNQYKWSM